MGTEIRGPTAELIPQKIPKIQKILSGLKNDILDIKNIEGRGVQRVELGSKSVRPLKPNICKIGPRGSWGSELCQAFGKSCETIGDNGICLRGQQ